MSFAHRSRDLLWRLGVRPALAHASRPVRATLEAPELLLRILEFLPIDDVCGPAALRVDRYARWRYNGNRCLKAVSREFCYAARHALTRGRWRPIRLLEQPRGHEQGVLLIQEATRDMAYSAPVVTGPCPALLKQAWDTDRGACLLMLVTNRAYTCDWDPVRSLGSKVLQLVEPEIPSSPPLGLAELADSSAFRRIVSAIEYAFGVVRSGDVLFAMLRGWLHWQEPDTLPGFEDGEVFHILSDFSHTRVLNDIVPQLGRLLEAWSDPELAGAFVVASISQCEYWDSGPRPTLTDYSHGLSHRWTDRDKARRFVDFLRSQQDLRDEAAARAREADAAGTFDVETAATFD